MITRRAHIHPYRSWRTWFRERWRMHCEVCGEVTTGHLGYAKATGEAWRHLAWHELVDRVLGDWQVPKP